VVVEASGSPLAISQAFQMVRRGGRISALGMIMKGIKIVLPFSSSYTSWEKALGLIASKKINVASLITQRFLLKEWSKAFSLIEKTQAIKVLFLIS